MMSTSSATAKKIEIMEEEPIIESKGKKSSQGRVLLTALAVISIVVLVVGIVLIILASQKKRQGNDNSGGTDEQTSSFCEYSQESKRIGLDEILLEAKKSYYDNHPFQLPNDPDATRDDIKEKYTA